MSSINDSKRLNDEELEAVAGGVTPLDPMMLHAMGHGFPGLSIPSATDTQTAAPPTIDPSAVAGLTHSTVGAAVAGGGGAYTVDTHTPTPTSNSTPGPTDSSGTLVTGQTQTTVSGSTLFGGSSLAAPDSHSSSTESVPSGTITISGNLHIDFQDPNPGPGPGIEIMHFDGPGTFTKLPPPTVSGANEGGGPNPGGVLGVAFKP